jgi:hypothetical protein
MSIFFLPQPRVEQDAKQQAPVNLQLCEPISKVVIPVQTGIQKFLQYIEKTG